MTHAEREHGTVGWPLASLGIPPCPVTHCINRGFRVGFNLVGDEPLFFGNTDTKTKNCSIPSNLKKNVRICALQKVRILMTQSHPEKMQI